GVGFYAEGVGSHSPGCRFLRRRRWIPQPRVAQRTLGSGGGRTPYPEGVGSAGARRLIQPVRGKYQWFHESEPDPGCAARPWAMRSNAFGVKTDTRHPTPDSLMIACRQRLRRGIMHLLSIRQPGELTMSRVF